MVRREVTETIKAERLDVWRRLLQTNKDKAHGHMMAALARMKEAGIFHHSEIARAAAQMAQGVATPEDFGISEVYGTATVACS